MQEIEPVNEPMSWKAKVLITGTVLGAAIGLVASYLLTRTAEESGSGEPPQISTTDAIKASIGVIGIVRGIAALGDRKR